MNNIKKFIFSLLTIIFLTNYVQADDLKSLGKFKDWESFSLLQEGNKVCFAQSAPVVRAPKKIKLLKKIDHLRQLYKMNTKFGNIINKYQRYNR